MLLTRNQLCCNGFVPPIPLHGNGLQRPKGQLFSVRQMDQAATFVASKPHALSDLITDKPDL
jgi:hypothetical protein